MLSETPRKTRQVIAIVMVIFALVTIFAEPLMVKQILPPIIAGQQARYEKMSASDVKEDQVKAELIKDTPFLVSFFYPFWMALGVFGCIVVLAIAKAYVEGKQWARGLALLCFSFVAMGGAYMLVPAINFTGFGTKRHYGNDHWCAGLDPLLHHPAWGKAQGKTLGSSIVPLPGYPGSS